MRWSDVQAAARTARPRTADPGRPGQGLPVRHLRRGNVCRGGLLNGQPATNVWLRMRDSPLLRTDDCAHIGKTARHVNPWQLLRPAASSCPTEEGASESPNHRRPGDRLLAISAGPDARILTCRRPACCRCSCCCACVWCSGDEGRRCRGNLYGCDLGGDRGCGGRAHPPHHLIRLLGPMKPAVGCLVLHVYLDPALMLTEFNLNH
jgi:hypothetical protein